VTREEALKKIEESQRKQAIAIKIQIACAIGSVMVTVAMIICSCLGI
jgi:hypothetical protein